MKTMIGIVLGSILAAAGWAMPVQEGSHREGVLKDAMAALRQEVERRDEKLKLGQVAWSAETIRRLDGPVLFPSEHSKLHREAELSEGPVEVQGLVLDSSGARVPGAEVRLASVDDAGYPIWDLARTTLSDDGGQFVFEDVSADRYHLRAELTGFKVAETRVDARYVRLEPVTLWLAVGSSRHKIFTPQRSPGQLSSLEAATVLSMEAPGGFIPYLIRKVDGLSYVGNRDYMEDRLPFRDRGEWEEAQAKAREFYALALDLEAGLQRFYPLLDPLAQKISAQAESLEAPFSALSEQQMVQALSTYLEYALYRDWLRLEGVSLDILDVDTTQLPDSEPVEAKAQRWLDDWDRRRVRLRSHLVRLGCFDSPHLETVAPFLKAFLGMSAVFKVKRILPLEEAPRPLLAIPFGMITVCLDHPGADLTIRTFDMHDFPDIP